MFKRYFQRVWDALHFAAGDGSWRLHPHELAVLRAAVESLPRDAQKVIGDQLSQAFFVERIPAGRINIIRFYEPDKKLALSDPMFSDLLIKIRMLVDGVEQVAHVVFYKGYIFDIEFKKPGKWFVGKAIAINGVKFGSPNETYTRGIDRIEHGRGTG